MIVFIKYLRKLKYLWTCAPSNIIYDKNIDDNCHFEDAINGQEWESINVDNNNKTVEVFNIEYDDDPDSIIVYNIPFDKVTSCDWTRNPYIFNYQFPNLRYLTCHKIEPIVLRTCYTKLEKLELV